MNFELTKEADRLMEIRTGDYERLQAVEQLWRDRTWIEHFRVELLDHGYLKGVDRWGSDQAIVEGARMSTGKGFLGWDPGPCPVCNGTGMTTEGVITTIGADAPLDEREIECFGCEGEGKVKGDQKLLAYLYDNKHSTPFEMAGLIFEVQAPILVFREWQRHRTQGYSEMSARYVPLPNLNYVPSIERLMMGSDVASNKQAGRKKGAPPLTLERAHLFRADLARMYEGQQAFYDWALTMGVTKELARVDLPVGRYSRMRATTNLRNWLAFLTLRCDKKAQWEIRQYALEVANVIAQVFPRTYDLFARASER